MSYTYPIFVSHYSNNGSILTLSTDKVPDEFYPYSIFNIAEEEKINKIILVEKSLTGFDEAIGGAKRRKKQLLFGLRLCLCFSMEEKSDSSRKTEHDCIIWLLNENGYKNLLRIWTHANINGLFFRPRIDLSELKKQWSDDLALSIPFYDSFIFNNLLRGYSCSPDFADFPSPTFFIENSQLPFDPILEEAVQKYCFSHNYETLNVKTIYYKNRSDFKSFLTMKTILNRSSFDKPECEHLSVDTFSIEYWRTLNDRK